MRANLGIVSILAALLLSGCSHHQTQTANPPAPPGDTEFTGVPAQPLDSFVKIPPRAALVALPPSATAPAPSVASAGNPPPVSGATVDNVSLPPDSSSTQATASTSIAVPGSEGAAGSPPAAAQPDLPATSQHDQVVVLQTSEGRIVIELDEFAAPKTCKNFRELIADGFYNNTVFHRVIPSFIIQGGDPESKSAATDRNTYGLGGPGYTLPAEIGLKHDRGAVAMARLPDSVNPQKESNGSQFYICVAACPSLDDQYTVFGHVIKGMNVVDAISKEPRDARDNPLKRIEMMASLIPKDQALGEDGSAANP